jgi:hypothetical protein
MRSGHPDVVRPHPVSDVKPVCAYGVGKDFGDDVSVYTVHEPRPDGSTTEHRAERLVFVPERFSLLAALFGIPWLLVNRLWLELIVLLGVLVGINVGGQLLGATQEMMALVSTAVGLLLGFEAQNLRRMALERAGYRLVAVVHGASRDEAERKFFAAWLDAQPKASAAEAPRDGSDILPDAGLASRT